MPGVDVSDGRQKPDPRARAKSVNAYSEMKRSRGWDDDKLRKTLERRGINAQSYFPATGLELSLFLPMTEYKKKDKHRNHPTWMQSLAMHTARPRIRQGIPGRASASSCRPKRSKVGEAPDFRSKAGGASRMLAFFASKGLCERK